MVTTIDCKFAINYLFTGDSKQTTIEMACTTTATTMEVKPQLPRKRNRYMRVINEVIPYQVPNNTKLEVPVKVYVAEPQGVGWSNPENRNVNDINRNEQANITYNYINYFNSNHNEGGAPASTGLPPIQSIADLAGQVVKTAGQVLANPVVEYKEQMSDRLQKITGVSDTITSQYAAGTVLGWNGRMEHLPEPWYAAEPSRVHLGDRFTRLKTQTMDASTTKRLQWTLPRGILRRNPALTQLFKDYYLWHSGLEVVVQVNTNQSATGLIIVAVKPYTVDEGASNVSQTPLLPSQVINLGTTNTAHLKIPWTGRDGIARTQWSTYWFVSVERLTPITFAPGATAKVEITVSARLPGLKLYTPIAAQGLDLVTVLPTSNSFLNVRREPTVSFGALIADQDASYMPLPISNLLQLARTFTFVEADYPVPEEEGQKILTLPVGPLAEDIGPTAVAMVARNFQQFTGAMVYRLTVTTSSRVTGKILVTYNPKSPDTVQPAANDASVVWDLGLQSSLDFKVNFTSDRPWLDLEAQRVAPLGAITAWTLTGLSKAAGAPTKLYIKVGVAIAENARFRIFRSIWKKNTVALANPQGQPVEATGEILDAAASADTASKEPGRKTQLDAAFNQTGLTAVMGQPQEVREFRYIEPQYNKVIPLEIGKGLLAKGAFSDLVAWCERFYYMRANLVVHYTATQDGRYHMSWNPAWVGGEHNLRQISGPLKNGQTISIELPFVSEHTVGDHSGGFKWGALYVDYLDPGYFSISFRNVEMWCPKPTNHLLEVPTYETFGILNTGDADTTEVNPPNNTTIEAIAQNNPFSDLLNAPSNFREAAEEISAAAEQTQITLDEVREAIHTIKEEVMGADFPRTTHRIRRSFNTLEEALEAFTKLCNETRQGVESIAVAGHTMSTGARIISALLKVIGGCVCIYYSSNKTATLTALGMVAGIDLLTNFDVTGWMIQELIKIGFFQDTEIPQEAQEQSLKSFADQGKAIEWIVTTLVKLVNLVRDFIKKEDDPEIRQVLETVKRLPELIKTIRTGKLEQVKVACELLSKAEAVTTNKAVKYHSILSKYHKEAKQKVERLERQAEVQRCEPVVLYIAGEPGSGKSVLVEAIAKCLAKAYGKDPQTQIYHSPPDADHMDGYAGQFIHVIDDLGQNPDGKDFTSFCQMVSTGTYRPSMASLEDKGKPYTSRFVLASSNLRSPTPVTVASIQAVQRRLFCHVEPILSQGFSIGGRLDVAKAAQVVVGEHPHYVRADSHLMNGTALKLKLLSDMRARKVGDELTPYQVIEALIGEDDRRHSVQDVMSQLFFQTRWVKLSDLPPDVACEMLEHAQTEEELKEMLDAAENKLNWLDSLRQATVYILPFVTLAVGVATLVSQMKSGKKEEPQRPEPEGPYQMWAAKKNPLLKKATPKEEAKPQSPPLKETIVSQGIALGEIGHKVLKNTSSITIFVKVEGEIKSSTQSCLALGGYDYLVNRHYIDCALEKLIIDGVEFIPEELSYTAYESFAGTTDLVLLRVLNQKKIQKKKDITRFLFSTREEVCESLTGQTVYGICNTPQFNFVWSGLNARYVPRILVSGSFWHHTIKYTAPTRAGYCGAPVLVRTPQGEKVIGIHCAGDGNTLGFAAVFSRYELHHLAGLDCPDEQGNIKRVEPADPPCHVVRKSKLKHSPFYGLFPVTAEPAILSNKSKRLNEGVDLDEVMWSKHNSNHEHCLPEMEMAAQIFAAQWKQRIPGNIAEPLSLMEALNGIPNLDAIDMAQSPGYPHSVAGLRKKDFIDVDESGVRIPKDHFVKLVEECAKEIQIGSYKHTTFQTFLKDELRPIEKARAGKTRLVDAGNLEHNTLGRMLFGRMFAWVHGNNGPDIGIAVGCNPDTDWTRYFHTLSEKKYVWDVDYSNYDASVGSGMYQALKIFLKEIGFGDLALSWIDTIHVSHHVYCGQQFDIEGGIPSGCAGTSIFNSIVNNIAIRAAILGAYQNPDIEDLCMVSYGDDVVFSTNQEIKPADLAEWHRDNCTGMKMTPASKSSVWPESMDWTDIVFLKRKFVADESWPMLIHPVMDTQAIWNSVSYLRQGEIGDTVRSLCELLWHSGPEVYNQFVEKLRSVPAGSELFYLPWSVHYYNWLSQMLK